MTDQSIMPVDPAKLNIRQAQVMKVLQLMTEGHQQAEACALASIKQRTYQRWVSKPQFRIALQQLAQDAITSAMVSAFNALPEAVSYQVQIATGKAGDPRDANKAAVFLRDLANTFTSQSLSPRKLSAPGDTVPADDGETSVTVTFTPNFARKKVDVETQVQQPPVVVEGTATVVEDASDEFPYELSPRTP